MLLPSSPERAVGAEFAGCSWEVHAVPLHLTMMPSSPTAQTLLASRTQTPKSEGVPSIDGNGLSEQPATLQRSGIPDDSPTQTVLASTPDTAYRRKLVAEGIEIQAVPFQRKTVPLSPTAQTLLGLAAQTPYRVLFAAPLVCAVQVVPFHFTILSTIFFVSSQGA